MNCLCWIFNNDKVLNQAAISSQTIPQAERFTTAPLQSHSENHMPLVIHGLFFRWPMIFVWARRCKYIMMRNVSSSHSFHFSSLLPNFSKSRPSFAVKKASRYLRSLCGGCSLGTSTWSLVLFHQPQHWNRYSMGATEYTSYHSLRFGLTAEVSKRMLISSVKCTGFSNERSNKLSTNLRQNSIDLNCFRRYRA